jgi:catechol 2,3-dioxygenase-like lactoylglutathione lyase family enzyme
MKRLHVHVGVTDLDRSVRFYSVLFGAAPTVQKPDYAKWLLDDPRVNFAISRRGHAPGINHLGIQVDSREELDDIAARLEAAAEISSDQEAASCCYARSHKTWSEDPSGVSWETFHTYGDAAVYGDGDRPARVPRATAAAASTCCGPGVCGSDVPAP